MQKISVIDSHTGGEPTRLIIDGFPDLGQGPMSERLEILAKNYDHYRQASLLEPRGNDVLVGALLCEPVDSKSCAGVIFFNNKGYLGMCGHGTIGLVRCLAHMGKITAGEHVIETPVGNISVILDNDYSVTVRNVPAWRFKKSVSLKIESLGDVTGDIAWGGNWFFLVSQHSLKIDKNNVIELTNYALEVQKELINHGIFGDENQPIDHIEFFAEDAIADSRNFVLCPGGAYDRSPCGTGTSAKLACLAADGKLSPKQIWRQASIIGSIFEAYYEPLPFGIQPIIRGQAYLCAESTLLIDSNDQFAWGII